MSQSVNHRSKEGTTWRDLQRKLGTMSKSRKGRTLGWRNSDGIGEFSMKRPRTQRRQRSKRMGFGR